MRKYDFIIVGGGILGMSTAMQLKAAYSDKSILLLEKEEAPAMHQTGRNSGVIHAGVYYTPVSLKAKFCLEGNRQTKVFCDEHDIPYETCGKILVATDDIELNRMSALWERTAANGVERYWLSKEELKEKEPNISGEAGILVPSTGIVDYSKIAKAMQTEFQQRGGEIALGAEVVGLSESENSVTVQTQAGEFEGSFLVTCAGLMSDRIVKMLGQEPDFAIVPFRGEYYRLREEHNKIVNHLIYPVPDASMPFLGVHVTKMVDGSVTVGPNAVMALKREGYKKMDFSLKDISEQLGNPGFRKVIRKYLKPGVRELRNSVLKRYYLREVQKYCPALTSSDLQSHPSGVRAQAVSRRGELVDDFLFINTKRSVNVCNAPSPAATSALPIGQHIVERVVERMK